MNGSATGGNTETAHFIREQINVVTTNTGVNQYAFGLQLRARDLPEFSALCAKHGEVKLVSARVKFISMSQSRGGFIVMLVTHQAGKISNTQALMQAGGVMVPCTRPSGMSNTLGGRDAQWVTAVPASAGNVGSVLGGVSAVWNGPLTTGQEQVGIMVAEITVKTRGIP